MGNKKRLVVETSLDLIYILPYYFYLVHGIYYYFLTKINLFISIPYVIYVCFTMPCSEIFFSRMVFSSILWIVPNNFFCHQPWWQPLVNTRLVSQFWEDVSSFNFLANALPVYHQHIYLVVHSCLFWNGISLRTSWVSLPLYLKQTLLDTLHHTYGHNKLLCKL